MSLPFYCLGLFVQRHRRVLILAWLALLVAALLLAPRLREVSREDVGGAEGREAARGERLMAARFGGRLARPLLLVLHAPARTVDDPAYARYLTGATLALLRLPYVARVFNHANAGDPSMVSADRRTTFCLIELTGLPVADVLTRAVPGIRAAVRALPHPPGLQADLTGADAVLADFTAASAEDLARIEARARPLAAIVLVLAFGGVVGAVVTLGMGLLSVAAASAGLYLIGVQVGGVPAFASGIVVLLGLSTGIDYSLILLTRFRDELQAGHAPEEAVARTVATAGRVVACAGALVLLGIAFLLVPDLRLLRLTAVAGLLVVALAVLAALTLLPALLPALASVLDWPTPLATWLRRWPVEPFWLAWHRRVTARPWLALAVGVPLFAALIAPVAGMRLWEVGVSVAPAHLESSRGYAGLQRVLSPGELDPVYILVQLPPGQGIWTDQTLRGLYRMSRELHAHPLVARVDSIVDMDPGLTLTDYRRLYLEAGEDPGRTAVGQLVSGMVSRGRGGDATLLRVLPREASSPATRAFVAELRARIVPGVPELRGAETLVTGTTARYLDLDAELYGPVPWMLPIYLLLTYALLLVFFRSAVLPLKALLVNALPVGAALGVLTLVSQHGWGAALLGPAPGAVMAQSPLVLFAILFGLSMDYEVLMLAQVQEERARTGDDREAVIQGLSRSARVVTGAAAIMLSVYVPFACSSLVPTREIGLGMATGVLLDATLVRLFLVPAAMVLLGRWNWWLPGRRP